MKTDTSWFLKAMSTTINLYYIRNYSFCYRRMRCYYLGGIHDGMVAILTLLGGRTKGVAAMQEYCSGRGMILRYPFCPSPRVLLNDAEFYVRSWWTSLMAL